MQVSTVECWAVRQGRYDSHVLDQLLGASPVLAAVREELARLFARLAASPKRLPPVLIQGETGTGKGLVAHVIHRMGPRADAAFIDVNCAAIPDALLEAELFGYERGAFTDARQAKAGLLQVAHRGTMFLDEIGLMPDSLQAKLLKALEDRSVRRLGSTRTEPADAWVLAATSEDLAAAIRVRRFREDLYHRLAVVTTGCDSAIPFGCSPAWVVWHWREAISLQRGCTAPSASRSQLGPVPERIS